jgi:hypothetical protein
MNNQNKVCFKINIDKENCHSLEVYEKSGGYQVSSFKRYY